MKEEIIMALRGRKSYKEQEEEKTIEISAQMQGSLTFKDPVNLKIYGHFSGSLDTKGTLTIGESARVEANINGDNIVIGGKVDGDIQANTMLVLMPTATLLGNISTPKLNIVEGAVFQGHCQMIKEHLLNIDEVAKYLEIDMSEIETLANSGQIPGVKNGDGWKFEQEKIEHWAAAGRIG